jgi:CheY-like chemotaxis protein
MKAGHSILVVEDEPKIRDGLKDFLEFQEFAVTVVDDGLEAERIVDAQRFDLILLDLMLPNVATAGTHDADYHADGQGPGKRKNRRSGHGR